MFALSTIRMNQPGPGRFSMGMIKAQVMRRFDQYVTDYTLINQQ